MNKSFDHADLAPLYDRGRLIPFIGSGLSKPACADWNQLLDALEQELDEGFASPIKQDPVQRAFFALQYFRRVGKDVKRIIHEALYLQPDPEIPAQTTALAGLVWPLVCTTNYDDLYCRAVYERTAQKAPPRVLGRSAQDCQQVMLHLEFPTREVIWSLQGFLHLPKKKLHRQLLTICPNLKQLEDELVVGHAEYRRAAHREPHFRRSFAHVFHSRSLLFLGSGLSEAYFRALFDEIVELSGPPIAPHFALIEDGRLDPDFMRARYHIICNTYPVGEHEQVIDFINKFSQYIGSERPRPSAWSYRAAGSESVDKGHAMADFAVVRAELPAWECLAESDAVAVSCSRKGSDEIKVNPSSAGAKAIGIPESEESDWVDGDRWTVKWRNASRAYGIVAREKGLKSSRARRSPESIYNAFSAFLGEMQKIGVRMAHVQILSAGKKRVFEPWVSIVQMARAYGDRYREFHESESRPFVRVRIYVNDMSVIRLLSGAYLDLSEHLGGGLSRISIQVTGTERQTDKRFEIAGRGDKLADIASRAKLGGDPRIWAYPIPTKDFEAMPLSKIRDRNLTVAEFGLVSGSTLMVDYRK